VYCGWFHVMYVDDCHRGSAGELVAKWLLRCVYTLQQPVTVFIVITWRVLWMISCNVCRLVWTIVVSAWTLPVWNILRWNLFSAFVAINRIDQSLHCNCSYNVSQRRYGVDWANLENDYQNGCLLWWLLQVLKGHLLAVHWALM